MEKYLRDPIGQSIGVFVAIMIALILFLIKRKRKKLSYSYSSTRLISTDSELKGKIDIVWEGTTVENVHLILLGFMNTGNIAIKKNDFDRDIIIAFDKESVVLESVILSTKPANLNPEIINDEHNVIIKPILLNKGDSIEIKLLVSNYTKKPIIDYRFMDIGKINRVVNLSYLSSKEEKILIGYSVMSGLLIISTLLHNPPELPLISQILYSIILIFGMFGMYQVFRKIKNKD